MNHKIRTLMAGCGGISRVWLEAIKEIPSIEMVGFVDLNIKAAQDKAVAYDWKDAYITDNLDEALLKTHPEAVFNCTTPEAHFNVTTSSLASGCHVLGEKPMADTLENAMAMIKAAEVAGKLFAVIQNRRYLSSIRRLRRFVEDGALGKITTINSDFYIGAHFGGFRDQMRHVLLLDMAIHTFDMARMITGANALSVYCHEWNPPGSWYKHDASANVIFLMTDDIVYTYTGSWCAEGLNTSWQGAWRVIGENGSLTWDGDEEFHAQIVNKKGGFFSEWESIPVPDYTLPPEQTGHAGLIREFIDCIRSDRKPETICTDNVHSLAMVLGAVESADSHKLVEIIL